MKVKIEGMSCGHCKMRVEKALNALEGVESAEVNLAEKSAEIKGNVSLEKVAEAISDTGYDFAGLLEK